MADIFLSYAHEDEKRAKQLRQALEEEGWSVWWDRTLLAGAPFKQEIVEEIQAARCVIPLWSSAAGESVWVKAETVQAWPRLVPVLLEKDLPIPEPFDILHAIDLSTWNAGDRLPDTLLESIAAKIPPQRSTAKPAVDGSVLLELLDDHDRVAETISEDERPALREVCLARMTSETLGARQRAVAGNALARLGDPRFRADAWFLSDDALLGFVEVPAGPFTMGSNPSSDQHAPEDERPQRQLEVPRFFVARYPVTVDQFRAFVTDSGYNLGKETPLKGLPNHPVAPVTWREAVAYCRWLTARLKEWDGTPDPLAGLLGDAGWTITLPSEAEWEKAARGSQDARIYPWGDMADSERANYADTGIKTSTAVGCFPGGRSPYGALDASGNVWEWTRSHFRRYPYDAADGREALDDAGLRGLRGGSSDSTERDVRCAYRARSGPIDRIVGGGFRVVASPFKL